MEDTLSRLFRLISIFSVWLAAASFIALGIAPASAQTEHRLALVIGNSDYKAGALPTSANDAGLLAQTLQVAGFEVTGARDLDQEVLRKTLRDFLDKVSATGPDTVAFVYLAGYGLQLEGDNYFVPVDAKITRDTDIGIEAVRIGDFVRALAALPSKSRFVVLDAARTNPFAKDSQLAGGLAYIEPDAGTLVAFNAAPGTIAPESKEPYGPYAKALSELIREGGIQPDDLFAQVRLRVNTLTKGAQVPWHLSKIQAPFLFMERAADAPMLKSESPEAKAEAAKPLRDMSAATAYEFALRRDSLAGYEEFLVAYPGDPLAKRVRVLVAARREAITWRKTRSADRPNAYWSYLKRYPHGPHVADARRRLRDLTAAIEPPAVYDDYAYDIAPPPSDEIIYVERPYVVFDDPYYDLLPPPPPVYVVIEDDYEDYAPPPPPFGPFFLPVPIMHRPPEFVHPPHYVTAPSYGPAIGAAVGVAAGAILLNKIILPQAVVQKGGGLGTNPPVSSPTPGQLPAQLPPQNTGPQPLVPGGGQNAPLQRVPALVQPKAVAPVNPPAQLPAKTQPTKTQPVTTPLTGQQRQAPVQNRQVPVLSPNTGKAQPNPVLQQNRQIRQQQQQQRQQILRQQQQQNQQNQQRLFQQQQQRQQQIQQQRQQQFQQPAPQRQPQVQQPAPQRQFQQQPAPQRQPQVQQPVQQRQPQPANKTCGLPGLPPCP
eukprot:gene9522-9601_t